MKILSLVTLISPLGEYGGPIRVALNQAKELIARGNDVTVAGAYRGFDNGSPNTVEDVPVALFPARTIVPGIGFAGLAAPRLQRSMKELTRDVDVVHAHAARDLVTLPAVDWVRRHDIPYVLQTHGMIDPSSNPLARPLDAWLTRKVLRAARQVFYLTEREKRDLTMVGGSELRLRELRNGVPEASDAFLAKDGVEVLFFGRLAPRKRPGAFVEMAMALAESFPTVTFRLAGPDEGEAAAVTRLIESQAADIAWEGAIRPENATRRLSRASVYVLPAVNEPYPMSVLEAMSLELPVVITESCGLASVVRESGCGMVVDGSVPSLVGAVTRLLGDERLRREMGGAGGRIIRERFGMAAIAAALEDAYSS